MWLAKSWQMVGSVGILADVLPTNTTTCQHLPNNECLLGRKEKSTALPNHKSNLAELPKYKHSLYQHYVSLSKCMLQKMINKFLKNFYANMLSMTANNCF